MKKSRDSHLVNRIALGIVFISLIMMIGTIVLGIANWGMVDRQIETEFGYVLILFMINGLVSVLLGWLIISRNSDHRLGWLLLTIGFLFSWWELSNVLLETRGLERIPALLQPIVVAGGLAYLLPLMLTITLVPLLFPTGRLISPRWRPVLVIAIVGIVGQTLVQGLQDVFVELPDLDNAGLGPILLRLQGIVEFILVGGIIGAMISLIVRFRRSRGYERTQMKWLVYTAVMSISLMLLLSYILGEESVFLGIFSSGLPIYLTIAIGIAILRHRLFDIDIIIRRTLQYAVLTGILALIYFGGIVTLQGIIGLLTGSVNSPVVTVITTLGIAALFNPLRIRIQDFIDQRFYRAKYDAEQTLASFAETARDEVDMEKLTTALVGVVDETMQPELTSLWLKQENRDTQ